MKVLDALTLFRVITALEPPEQQGHEGFGIYEQVYSKVKQGHQRVLVTGRIATHYEEEAKRHGFPVTMISSFLRRLQDENMFTRRAPGGHSDTIEDLPRYHRVFLQDAVGAGAAFFITRRPAWLNIAGRMQREHGLRIVTPEQFLEDE